MSATTAIEWTQATWNPLTGCTKISPGCKHCYAERLAHRLQAMGNPSYAAGFSLALHERVLALPYSWRSPKIVFVNSMSDLFHQKVPWEYIERVFEVMRATSWHQYQVLTKRSERLAQMAGSIDWPRNVWMGVSVERQDYSFRIDHLRRTGSAVKFLSLEPLLGAMSDLDLDGIDWVIVGGESGPGARPIEAGWVREIRDQCTAVSVPFFFKQWGGVNKKRTGRLLDGRTWEEWPVTSAPGQPSLLRAVGG